MIFSLLLLKQCILTSNVLPSLSSPCPLRRLPRFQYIGPICFVLSCYLDPLTSELRLTSLPRVNMFPSPSQLLSFCVYAWNCNIPQSPRLSGPNSSIIVLIHHPPHPSLPFLYNSFFARLLLIRILRAHVFRILCTQNNVLRWHSGRLFVGSSLKISYLQSSCTI